MLLTSLLAPSSPFVMRLLVSPFSKQRWHPPWTVHDVCGSGTRGLRSGERHSSCLPIGCSSWHLFVHKMHAVWRWSPMASPFPGRGRLANVTTEVPPLRPNYEARLHAEVAGTWFFEKLVFSSKWRRPHLKPLAMETTLAWQHRWGAVLACSAAEVVSFSRTGQASSPMARRHVPVRPLGVASSLDWTWCTDLAELLRAMTRKDVRFRRMNLVVFTLDCLAFQATCCDAGG